MALNFDNTEIAFQAQSNKDLRKSYRLFRLLNSSTLSKLGKQVTMVAFNLGLPIKGLVKRTIFEAFVGGESIDESQGDIKKLGEYGIQTALDYGVEAKNDEKELDKIAEVLVRKIAYVKEDPNANIATAKVTALSRDGLLVKVSQGEALDAHEEAEWERVVERMDMISKTAYESGNALYFDAEESWLQPAIDALVQQMMRKYNQTQPIIYNTIQLYRHDRLTFLKELHKEAATQNYILAVKLVRGAYMEKERKRAEDENYLSPIHKDKASVDKDYNLAVEYCMSHIDNIAFCLASHNEESNYLLEDLSEKYNIPKTHPHILSCQLFGMGDHITFNMASEGFNTAKYLPYGPVKELLPYLLRRANENSSVDGQASRELLLAKKEMRRRGLIS
ncbi:MAG: proline dehydrogenase family protein [Saprospiraceae bacterium]|nr:proline dehydrogenase family protein [Saprospiraceae bacterium]